MLSLLEEFEVVDHTATAAPDDRALATVLFTDIVGSTAHAIALGDHGWRRVLDHHDGIARSAVTACGGQLVKGTGDGILATFDSPAHGLDCAKALRAALAHAGIAIPASTPGKSSCAATTSRGSASTSPRGWPRSPFRVSCSPRAPSAISSPAPDTGSPAAGSTRSRASPGAGSCSRSTEQRRSDGARRDTRAVRWEAGAGGE
jgi:hypothetical protein